VLNDVAFRPVPEEPAGEDAIPFVVPRLAHVELHEGAGLGRVFPRCGLLARAHAHHGGAPAERLARLHLKIAGEAVALVEDADHGHTLGHGRAGQGVCRSRYAAHWPGLGIGRGFILALLLATARGEQPGHGEAGQPPARRDAPAGNHASGAQDS
jgi:hypothetical protein